MNNYLRNDILPTIIVEGKPTEKIETEFFIVNVNNYK